MTTNSGLVVVLITASNDGEARRIGRALVTEQLAACVNVVGSIRSIYRWEGAVRENAERLLVVKAASAGAPTAGGSPQTGFFQPPARASAGYNSPASSAGFPYSHES